MRHLIRKTIRRIRNEDDGFSLPFIASTLVLLLGISAFAVDLGWIYLNGSRVQRAADSSALAGVVFLPWDLPNVAAKAVDGASANGYDVGTVNGSSIGTGPDVLDWQSLSDNRLQVTLTTEVDTYFLKVLGFDSFTMSRTATAQFIKPVPLGSPANCIGIGGSVTGAGLPSSASSAFSTCNSYPQNFWSAINGRETDKLHGDPYAVACGYNCSGGNSQYDPYYYFAVDVPPGATWVDVFLYDAGFYDRPDLNTETGDFDGLSNTASGGTHMSFDLYQPDTSPQIPEDNSAHATCSLGTNSLNINSGSNSSTYRNRWARMCRISNVVEGIYVLRVRNGGNSIGGTNQYSLLADSDAATMTRVYSLNEMSIYTNDGGTGLATVYIAEVDPVHANKILELKFFDGGETNGNGTMTVVPPPGVSGYSCSWTATNVVPGPSGVQNSGSTCSIDTSDGGDSKYNGEWITMQIQLPSDYTCSTDCFWKMNLALQVAHDRTTWEARVLGNPVALVPNS